MFEQKTDNGKWTRGEGQFVITKCWEMVPGRFGKEIKMKSKAIQQTLKTDEEAKVSIVQSQISIAKHNPRSQVQC